MINLLLSIPADVIRDHVAPFFDVLSLVRLDSAAFSKEHRPNILSCILLHVKLSDTEIQYSKSAAQWLISRGVQLTNLTFPPDSTTEDVLHALPFLSAAEDVVMTNCTKLDNACLSFFLQNCGSALVNIYFNGCAWLNDETLQVLADKHSSTFGIFTLGNCPLVTDAGVAYVVSKCGIICVHWDACTQIGELSMAALAHSRVDDLSIKRCPGITENSLVNFLQNCGDSLETLSLAENGQLTDKTLGAISRHCRSLLDLNVMECTSLTDVGYCNIICSCQQLRILRLDNILDAGLDLMSNHVSPHLQILCFGDCPSLTDRHVAAITARCPGICHFRISGSDLISDRALQSIGANLPGLTNLSFQICSNVATRDGIRALVRGCPLLEEFQLGLCPKICDSCLEEIAAHCKNLRDFSVTDNTKVTDAGLYAIAARCTDLEIVNFSFTSVSEMSVEHLINNCLKITALDLEGRGSLGQSLRTLVARRNITLTLSDE